MNMAWLQENWIIAVVALLVVIALVWWLLARRRPVEIAPPAIEPAAPTKPLAPVKPDIVAAEPARFKPIEPVATASAPAPPKVAPVPPAPTAEPVAAPPAPKVTAPKATPPKPATPAPKPARMAAPKATAKPAAKPAPKPAPAPAAKADNLQLLKGVGPKLVALLTSLGVTRFDQVAAWTDADVAAIDPQLGTFQGRIARDNWIDQAAYLARGDKAGFEAKYGALGGEL
jgi:predicted flap endonuclease-1-like 5' DNA nuclease